MSNQEQLEILKQGVDTWNKWRDEHNDLKIDISGANFIEAKLNQVNFRGCDLSYANLNGVDLKSSNLQYARIYNADLRSADFSEADLCHASFKEANLRKANLHKAKLLLTNLDTVNLREADLSCANFVGAKITDTDLRKANLVKADLSNANFYKIDLRVAKLGYTNLENVSIGSATYGNTDLRETIGLETIHHTAPSFVDTQTLQLSKGKIPGIFLRGCGLSDWEIESAKLYNPDLTNEEIVRIQYCIFDLRAAQAIQISPLFISCSHADTPFVNRIDQALTAKGVRFWRDIHDAKAGRLETQIDLAIRQNPTVLLILSKNSIKSDWVEHEVRHARKLEKELGRDALCPIALDDAWKSSPWPERVMEQIMEYNILDFSGWQDTSTFDSKFAKLLSGLEIFYKKPAP
jgi:uncharacterized protein YjbI with pentapeptide repeats